MYEQRSESTIDYPNLPIKSQYGHCSLFLNDSVYVLGGSDDDDNTTDQVWKMNLKQSRLAWQKIASMNKFRCMMGATVYKDVLIVAGSIK